jgi:nitrogen-specific signal transduction histidine kinase
LLQLQAEAERAQVEAQLQRTQRLEGLGQLAGGVAHDFNNLIAVISNYATFIAETAAEDGLTEIAADAAQITKAAQRGADLTHQLLAFARREVVRPRPLSLNDVVTDIEQMLRRSIGEHITLDVRLQPGLPSITADPGQLDQVLVNLAVNARDAMPRGGTLTIETRGLAVDRDYTAGRPHLRTGRYVRLRVSDTGTGMPPEVIERAFEPFYTTKPAGKGTGLGLATVYGIITAAGGDLSIYSEPGLGTTFTILMPTTDAQPAEAEEAAEPPRSDYRPGTVLAVEDEPALRDVLRRILAGAGHEVLIAADGPAALDLAQQHAGPIDVLLTDVVMPHMLGRDLAERFLALAPGACVLFMSGYARPALDMQGTLDPDVTLVEKPFSKTQLLAAVQQCLERR